MSIGLSGAGGGTPPVAPIVRNGDFSDGLSEWTQNSTAWTASAGTAVINASGFTSGDLFLRQATDALVGGATYEYTLVVAWRVNGSVTTRVIGATTIAAIPATAAAGTFTGTFVCPANPVEINMSGNANADLAVDLLSFVRVS